MSARITNIIYDYFNYVNVNKQIISDVYFKNKYYFFINKNNNNNGKLKLKPINNINNNNNFINNVEVKTKNEDMEKSSAREINLISLDKNKNNGMQPLRTYNGNIRKYDKYINNNNDNGDHIPNNKKYKLMFEKHKDDNITTNSKSIHQSFDLLKNNSNSILINKTKSKQNYSNNVKTNNCSSKQIILIVILFIVIVIQIISIPLIIINSYSY